LAFILKETDMTDENAAPRRPVDMAEQVPAMSDVQLKVLRENVVRLQVSGSAKQKTEAERLLPLITAEIAARKPAPSEKVKRAGPVKKRVKAAAKQD
jgi:hypothetical protein